MSMHSSFSEVCCSEPGTVCPIQIGFTEAGSLSTIMAFVLHFHSIIITLILCTLLSIAEVI